MASTSRPLGRWTPRATFWLQIASRGLFVSSKITKHRNAPRTAPGRLKTSHDGDLNALICPHQCSHRSAAHISDLTSSSLCQRAFKTLTRPQRDLTYGTSNGNAAFDYNYPNRKQKDNSKQQRGTHSEHPRGHVGVHAGNRPTTTRFLQ